MNNFYNHTIKYEKDNFIVYFNCENTEDYKKLVKAAMKANSGNLNLVLNAGYSYNKYILHFAMKAKFEQVQLFINEMFKNIENPLYINPLHILLNTDKYQKASKEEHTHYTMIGDVTVYFNKQN